MFEFSIALRYLLPKKRALSTSLIALLSVAVISLVVWLLLVFLSVTSGMEKNWLDKLTSLHAPVRISPTPEYYQSYYYNIDQIALNSDFQLKTIGEKNNSFISDPYDPEMDREIPFYWPAPDKKDEGLKDPVKRAFSSLSSMENLSFQDYEISAALMKLQIENGYKASGQVLSQMSYLLSFTNKNPHLSKLLLKPRTEDLNHILKKLEPEEVKSFFTHANIQAFTLDSDLSFTLSQFQLAKPVRVFAKEDHLIISNTNIIPAGYIETYLTQISNHYYLRSKLIDSSVAVTFEESDSINGKVDILESTNAISKNPDLLAIRFENGLILNTSFFPFTIAKADPTIHFSTTPKHIPLWAYHIENKGCFFPESKKTPILLPRIYQKNDSLLKSTGEFVYQTVSTTSTQDQKISFEVVGFYDPGVMPMGSKLLLVPVEVIRTINASVSPIGLDDTPLNGIFVWFDDLYKATTYKDKIQTLFDEKGISKYWKIETFQEYGFAIDLLQQFQSERTLFTLIGIIILIVACCNISSLLIMLVNDKKKEIALLQALGAKPKSIALIFGLCGIILGGLGALIGSSLAVITLKNMDVLTSFLSAIQGHQAFNAAFFGDKLPSTLSVEALLFVGIATPLIALLAGLIPALKASRINPAKVMRSV